MAKGKIWRGGMIGAGAWSATQLEAWASVPNVKIVALTDRHPERLEPIVKQFNIPHAFTDFEAMLDQGGLDFVDICTRPYSHLKLCKMTADRGLPILCQKPFCASLEEAIELASYCQQAGVRLMVNENYRWQPWFRKARDLIHAGAIGRPFFARFHHRLRISLPKFDHYQRYFAEMPHALLYDVGTHLIDLARFMFGEPQNVYCRRHRIGPDMTGEDFYTATIGYQDLSVILHDSWASVPVPGLDITEEQQRWPPRLLEVDGTLGTLVLKVERVLHLYTVDDHQSWQYPLDSTPRSYILGQQHFIDCLETGAEFETSGEDAINTMRVLWAAYRSADEGKVVEVGG